MAATGLVWPQAGCHSRQGSSLGKVQHCLHHIGAVLGTGLTEWGAVGLGGAGGVSGVPAALGGPLGVPAHHGQLLPVGCVDPRCLWQAVLQVCLVPHQHEWQGPLCGLWEGRAAQGSLGLAASSCCFSPSLQGAAELCHMHWLHPVTPVPCRGAECSSRPNTNTSEGEKLGWPPTLLCKQPSSLLSRSCSPRTVWSMAQPGPKTPAPFCGGWVPVGPFLLP